MGLFGIAFPWETVEGEGFMAPWTEKVETPGGLAPVSAAGPGDDLFSAVGLGGGWGFDDPSGPPVSPLPSGRTAGIQETWQEHKMATGGGGVPAVPIADIPLNVGQGEGPQPGDDLLARAKRLASGIFPGMGTAGIQPATNGQAIAAPAAAGGGGLLGLLGTGAAALGTLALSRLKMPWETPEGEGFIAPWTQQQQLPSGLWGQEGQAYGVPAGAPGLAGMTYGQLKGGVPVKAWTNAARNGRSGPTVAFVMFSNGMMASQSLIDGTIKTWRPKKHIVISRNPRLSNIRKLDKLHARMEKTLRPYAKTVFRTRK